MIYTVLLIIVLIAVAYGTLPKWGHMTRFELGWFPPAAATLLLGVVLILWWRGGR